MSLVCSAEENERRNRLIQEIRTGEKQKDVLPNASHPFEKERQATYFSHTRRNMRSDMARATMRQASNAADLRILEVLRNERLSV